MDYDNSRSMRSLTGGTTEAPPDVFYDDLRKEWTRLERQRAELARRQEALTELDRRVAEIGDDQEGYGNILFTGKTDATVVTVSASVPDLSAKVKSLIEDFSWPRGFDIGYETEKHHVTLELKTDLETLTADHRGTEGSPREDSADAQ